MAHCLDPVKAQLGVQTQPLAVAALFIVCDLGADCSSSVDTKDVQQLATAVQLLLQT